MRHIGITEAVGIHNLRNTSRTNPYSVMCSGTHNKIQGDRRVAVQFSTHTGSTICAAGSGGTLSSVYKSTIFWCIQKELFAIATMSLSSSTQEPQTILLPPVAQARQNDVIMEQSWNKQDLCSKVKNTIHAFAPLYWSSRDDRRRDVIAAAAERMKSCGVRIVSFDAKTNQSVIVSDETAIEKFILEAFVQHDPNGANVEQNELRDERDLIPVKTTVTGESMPPETMMPTSECKEIVDITNDGDEDDIAALQLITQRDVQCETPTKQREHAIPMAISSPLLSNQTLPLPVGHEHDEIILKERESQQYMDVENGQRAIQAAHQSSGERTNQRVAKSPLALSQQSVEQGEKRPQQPSPPEFPAVPGAVPTTLPASFADTYADCIEPANWADLPSKRAEDMLGWQFFPIQLTQSLRDLPLINEWKIVVTPLNSSSGQAFCIDL